MESPDPLAPPPRRVVTKAEKDLREAKYRVEPAEFDNILENIAQQATALMALSAALATAGKGAYLAFPNGAGQFWPFNRRHLKNATAAFVRQIRDLKNYLKVAKKKSKKPSDPSSFKGVFMPVFAGAPLTTFFVNGGDGFGYANPMTAAQLNAAGRAGELAALPTLMSQLDNLKNGYTLRNTLTMLFYIYIHSQQLQSDIDSRFNISDAVMNTAFGGDIKAEFYKVIDASGTEQKLPMWKAPVESQLNTYDVIRTKYSYFLEGTPIPNPDYERYISGVKKFKKEPPATFPGTNTAGDRVFNSYFFQNIASLNYYSRALLLADERQAYKEIAATLADNGAKQLMLNEHNIVKQATIEWKQILEPQRKAARKTKK